MYPIQSPNGSTIVLYGHEQGLRIIWRGGRAFKSATPPQATPKANGVSGASSADAMVIDDSEEEEEPEGPEPEFEDVEEEPDPSDPYHKILRHMDIPLGARVLQLAIPYVPWNISKAPPGAYPPILSSNIVVAAACSDCSTRLITLSLTPPAPTLDDTAKNSSILNLGTQYDLPSSVAITHTGQELGAKSASTSRSRSRGPPARSSGAPPAPEINKQWSFLVATHHNGGSGRLLIYQVPVVENPTFSFDTRTPQAPLQRQHLQAPASKIAFNPSPYPAARHCHLLVTHPSGSVKLYSCFSSRSSKIPRGRQGADADTEGLEREGRWLITLYPGFGKGPDGRVRRKRVIDAEWVLSGRAIIALFADAE